jgi:hypothetical protein
MLDILKQLLARKMGKVSAQPPSVSGPRMGGHGVTVDRAAEERANWARQDREHALKRQRIAENQQDQAFADQNMLAPSSYKVQGGSTFLSADPNKMTGAQRQIFLPQNAGMGGHEDSGFAGDQGTGGGDFQRYEQQSAQRLGTPGQLPGSTQADADEEETRRLALR